MPKQTVIDNEYVTLWYHPDKRIVHHYIKKFIFGEPFHEFLLTGTELIYKNRAKKWLSNDLNCPVLSKEDIDWGDVNWFPKTVKAGWKYWAIVRPKKVLGQMGVEKLVEKYSKAGIVAQFFTDPDDAMKWLENQD
jgi:hypothetical protein